MKKILFPALLALAGLVAAPAAQAQTVYKLQPQLSTLGWEGKAVTHGHNGTIQFASGDLLVKDNMVVGGTTTVDMKTLKATDITDAEQQGKFVGHMSSDDFFGAEKNPTSTFKIVSVTPIKGAAATANNATIVGDMMIKGVTNRLTFPAKVGVKNGVAAATGKVTIDRTKFGLKYGSKSFFDSIGDKAIYDDFTLDFNVVAKQ
ncbi:YceI family protein [Hymenobacter sp. PAMC 26628]|uniref:YceI family protein n=1 Tax=Hymenobacter sp. PAMC 26628 TaxID=1484118 RepID=UPI00076FE8AE|nr:YceI family protein [Hymenobacter sp. PAMC 26628]AMJ64942.1 lipid-binding protein [Hymenobacter sp. PAMC 26628]